MSTTIANTTGGFPAHNPFETIRYDQSAESQKSAQLVYQKTVVACQLVAFQIGYMLFEWGSARRKNADTTLVKHLVLLSTSAIIMCIVGFGLAYGEPHMIGTRYYMSIRMVKDQFNPENDHELTLNYLLLILSSSVTSVLSVSSLNER